MGLINLIAASLILVLACAANTRTCVECDYALTIGSGVVSVCSAFFAARRFAAASLDAPFFLMYRRSLDARGNARRRYCSTRQAIVWLLGRRFFSAPRRAVLQVAGHTPRGR